MRIIAGRYRRRIIQAPPGLSTRPTTDRVREAVFSILGDLTGTTVVDFYAGSGALGLEAASRGASRVLLVESERAALAALHANVKALGATHEVTVGARNVEQSRALLLALAPLDVVLADPPWPIATPAASAVARVVKGLLGTEARVLLGHRASEPFDLDASSGLTLVERRAWGDSAFSFFSPTSED